MKKGEIVSTNVFYPLCVVSMAGSGLVEADREKDATTLISELLCGSQVHVLGAAFYHGLCPLLIR